VARGASRSTPKTQRQPNAKTKWRARQANRSNGTVANGAGTDGNANNVPNRSTGTPETDKKNASILRQRGTAAATEQKQKTKPTRKLPDPSKPPDYSTQFERFWHAYPLRADGSRPGSKLKASVIYDRLSENDRDAAINAIPAYIRSLAHDGKGYRYVVTTWLNGRRWESFSPILDENRPKTDQNKPKIPENPDTWRELLRAFKASPHSWPDWAGPSPYFTSCRVPRDLYAEVGLNPPEPVHMVPRVNGGVNVGTAPRPPPEPVLPADTEPPLDMVETVPTARPPQ
jgi:hypothetical protein